MHDHTEEEKNCWERLGIHRRNLGELLMQQSKCGSGMVPLGIVNGIIDEQKRISSVKTSLRTLGCDVPDLPDDVPRADDDGQIASAGFSALRELSLQQPGIREQVGEFRAELQAAGRHINTLAAYKNIHDHFQKLESCYSTIHHFIYYQGQIVPFERLQWHSLERSEPDLQAHIDELLACLAIPILANEQRAWQQQVSQTLRRAYTDLQTAIWESNAVLLKRATEEMRRLLDREPSRINDRMCGAVDELRGLRPDAKLRSLSERISPLANGEIALRLIARFEQGVEAVARLSDQLGQTINSHNDFQELDNQLRRVETGIDRDVTELLYIWSDLRQYADRICASVDDDWSIQLNLLTSEMEQAVTQQTSPMIVRCFHRYRSLANRGFNALDTSLLGLCNELKAFGGSIDPLLEML